VILNELNGGMKEDHMLVLKGKDSGIMVSDFICEKTGYLMMKNMKLPKLNTLRKRVLDLT